MNCVFFFRVFAISKLYRAYETNFRDYVMGLLEMQKYKHGKYKSAILNHQYLDLPPRMPVTTRISINLQTSNVSMPNYTQCSNLIVVGVIYIYIDISLPNCCLQTCREACCQKGGLYEAKAETRWHQGFCSEKSTGPKSYGFQWVLMHTKWAP